MSRAMEVVSLVINSQIILGSQVHNNKHLSSIQGSVEEIYIEEIH